MEQGFQGESLLVGQEVPNDLTTGPSTGFLPDLTRVKFGSARPARRCRISNRRYRPNPPCPSLALSGNRTDQSATGRLVRRSSGTRFMGAAWLTRGDRLYLHPPRLWSVAERRVRCHQFHRIPLRVGHKDATPADPAVLFDPAGPAGHTKPRNCRILFGGRQRQRQMVQHPGQADPTRPRDQDA